MLAASYRRFTKIWDPDFATIQDVEAWDKIRRDCVIAHAIEKRSRSVAGIEWRITPASDSPGDKRAGELIDALIRHLKKFQKARTRLARDAIFRGSAYEFIEGDRQKKKLAGDDTVRNWWTPINLKHVDRYRFQIVRDPVAATKGELRTFWEMFSVERQVWERLEYPEWFIRSIFEETESALGYGYSLMNSIYFYWRAKEVVLAQGLAGLERWAQGLVIAKIDDERIGGIGRDNDTIQLQYEDQLLRQRSEHIFTIGKNDDIKIQDAPGNAWQMVKEMLDYLDRGLNQLILTSVLPTGGGGEVGSFSRAETEADQMEATFQADRETLSEDITDSLIALVWKRNLHNIASVLINEGMGMAQMPRFEILNQVKEDTKVNAETAQIILESGVPLVKEEYYDRIGWKMPVDDEEVVEAIEPPAAGGFPGMGAGAFRSKIRSVLKEEIKAAIYRSKQEKVLGNGR